MQKQQLRRAAEPLVGLWILGISCLPCGGCSIEIHFLSGTWDTSHSFTSCIIAYAPTPFTTNSNYFDPSWHLQFPDVLAACGCGVPGDNCCGSGSGGDNCFESHWERSQMNRRAKPLSQDLWWLSICAAAVRSGITFLQWFRYKVWCKVWYRIGMNIVFDINWCYMNWCMIVDTTSEVLERWRSVDQLHSGLTQSPPTLRLHRPADSSICSNWLWGHSRDHFSYTALP